MHTYSISGFKERLKELKDKSICIKILSLFTFLIAVHSFFLGLIIYFFTEPFYDLFFATTIKNLFFVRQSGIFLTCMSFFYFIPVWDVKRFHPIISIIILTKILAVIFLVSNAAITAWPFMIYITALLDGLMGMSLFVLYIICWKKKII